VQEKSRGVVVFAFNTDKINYVSIAEKAARLVHYNLNLPVTLITEVGTVSDVFDNIIYVSNTMPNVKPGEGTHWRNGDRYRAFNLSPYDETILLDSDYLVLDKSLLNLFDQEFDYRIVSDNTTQQGPWPDVMGAYSLQYLWATVVVFRKTNKAQMLFDLVGRIQRNYIYYWSLYQVGYGSFRNDFAFTIADNMLNGYNLNNNNLSMFSYTEKINSISIKNGLLTIKEKDKAIIVPRQNLHIMDKFYLLSENFDNLVRDICKE
jgi:hypothetical protein